VSGFGGVGGASTTFVGLRTYVGIARPSHWIKNVFMLPGAAVALVITPHLSMSLPLAAAAAIVSVCLLSSANYTINEYLDREHDRFHPLKNRRPGALGLLDPRLVLLQYCTLAACGLMLAWTVNQPFLLTGICLLVMGLAYNLAPLRTKDRAYLDVLSESINSPIRFLLGWFMVTAVLLPPSSVLFAYWMGGAFLMAVKRYAEYRSIGDAARAAYYRRAFARYSERALLLSSFFYALCAAFFIGIFLIKYRIEFVLTFPLFATLFTWYLAIGLRQDSAAQAPEKLYRESAFMAFAGLTFLVALFMLTVDLPFLRSFMEPHLIHVRP